MPKASITQTVKSPRELGALVRASRLRHELTQAQLAEQLDVSRAWVNGLERGSTNPTLVLLFKVFAALELTMTFGSDESRKSAAVLDDVLSSYGTVRPW